jgi:hypothetical protein
MVLVSLAIRLGWRDLHHRSGGIRDIRNAIAYGLIFEIALSYILKHQHGSNLSGSNLELLQKCQLR